MKKIIKLMLCLMFMFVFMGKAQALTFETTNDVVVGDDNINYKEAVDGDMYVAGNKVTISSNVKGDIIGAGNIVNVAGSVNNSIRMIGGTLNYSDLTAKNISVIGSDILFMNVDVNRIYAAGASIEFMGTANNLNLVASDVIISGTINGDSTIYADTVTIKGSAVINAKLNVNAKNEIKYEGFVNDKTNIVYTKADRNYTFSGFFMVNTWFCIFYKILSMCVIAFIMMALFNNFIEKSIKQLKESKFSTIVYGLLIFMLVPIFTVITLTTVIGIPLAIIVILSYIIALLMAGSFSSIALGKYLFKDINPYASTFFAILLLAVLSMIPLINVLVWLATVGYMFSSISLLFYKKKKKQ